MSGRYERELVNTLETGGEFVAMRAPASGGATDRDLPDVLAMRAYSTLSTLDGDALATLHDEAGRIPPLGEILAVEHKSTSKNVVYVEPHEVAALERFADTAGAEPLLGCRFKDDTNGREHYLVHPADAGRTDDAGNYSVHIEDAADVARWYVNASTNEVSRL